MKVSESTKHNFALDMGEIDTIRYALRLLQKDMRFDLKTFSSDESFNLERASNCIDVISQIDFLLNKIKF